MPLFKRIFSGWLYRFIVKVLQCGPIPRHIAYIMDGNRRYAKKSDISRIEGHSSGFGKIMEVVDWCLDIGIAEISFYTFSIENFKRSEEEVQELLALLLDRFQGILNRKERMEEKGYCFRIFGDLSLLPASLQQTAAKLNLSTWNNTSQSLL